MYGRSSRSDAQLWWTSQSMMGPEYKLRLLSCFRPLESEEPSRVRIENVVAPAAGQPLTDILGPLRITVRVAAGIHQHVLQARSAAPQAVQRRDLVAGLCFKRMAREVQRPGREETM